MALPPSSSTWTLAEEILDQIEFGVVVFNDLGTPVFANNPARKLLDLPEDGLPARIPFDAIASVVRRVLSGEREVTETTELWGTSRRGVRLRATVLGDETGVLLTVNDITIELQNQSLRKQFVSNVSHELKSPVASIQTLAEAIERAGIDDPEAVTRFTRKLVAESSRMGRLIRDLLDLSKLEEPGALSRERVDFAGVVATEVNRVRPEAERSGLRVDTDIQEGPPLAGDAGQLARMVQNLLANALRYTPNGGTILVQVGSGDGNIELKVEDDGIGIPLRHQGRVFERFYRVDEARSRDQGGTGLGLAIVKHVAELHGGHITLESHPGEGSRFIVRLPYRSDRSV
jgi:two-component system sensor histidine kinase SenX3